MALVLAAGVANGAVIQTEDYGQVAIRGKTQHVEQIARVEIEAAPNDPERQIKKTTIRLKPTTTLTLLAQDGTVVEMEGDEALLGFITANKRALTGYLNQKFKPMYSFDFAGMGRWLDRIRLKGKYPMYTAQKHVVGATVRGFQSRDSILLVGSMGTGKTLMGGSTAIGIASGVVEKLRGQIADDQVVLIVAPPHLVEKWKRELHSISRNIYVERLDRHEDVKRFMDKAARLGSGIAKIGLIKRDMTKLGGRVAVVVWRRIRGSVAAGTANAEGMNDTALSNSAGRSVKPGVHVSRKRRGRIPASEAGEVRQRLWRSPTPIPHPRCRSVPPTQHVPNCQKRHAYPEQMAKGRPSGRGERLHRLGGNAAMKKAARLSSGRGRVSGRVPSTQLLSDPMRQQVCPNLYLCGCGLKLYAVSGCEPAAEWHDFQFAHADATSPDRRKTLSRCSAAFSPNFAIYRSRPWRGRRATHAEQRGYSETSGLWNQGRVTWQG